MHEIHQKIIWRDVDRLAGISCNSERVGIILAGYVLGDNWLEICGSRKVLGVPDGWQNAQEPAACLFGLAVLVAL